MRLRPVELGDVDVYVQLRCDPIMMAELGGPQPCEDMRDKVLRDVEAAAAAKAWTFMIVSDERASTVVAGTVTLYTAWNGGWPRPL